MHPHASHVPSLVTVSLLTLLIAPPSPAQEADKRLAGDGAARIESKIRKLRCDGDHPGLKRLKRAYLGVELTDLTPDLRRHFGVPAEVGVMVGEVAADSAAQRAGLQVGDIVTRADGEEIAGSWDLTNVVRSKEGGATLDLEVWRNGKVGHRSATLGERETCVVDVSNYLEGLERLGENLEDLPALEIGQEAMEGALRALREVDWDEQVKRIQKIELRDLDVRMEELQKHLAELQERMALESERIGEETSRRLEKELRKLEDQEKVRVEVEQKVRQELIRAQEQALRGAEKRNEAIEQEMRAKEEAIRKALAKTQEKLEVELEEAEKQAAEDNGGGGDVV